MKTFQSTKYWIFDLDNTLYSGDTKIFEQVSNRMTKYVSDKLIKNFIHKDFVPIIAPMGLDEKMQAYNINADTAAGALAISLKSRRLLLMTDVEGVYDENNKLIS